MERPGRDVGASRGLSGGGRRLDNTVSRQTPISFERSGPAPDPAGDHYERRIRSFQPRRGRVTAAQRSALDRLWPRWGVEVDGQRQLDLATLFTGAELVTEADEKPTEHGQHGEGSEHSQHSQHGEGSEHSQHGEGSEQGQRGEESDRVERGQHGKGVGYGEGGGHGEGSEQGPPAPAGSGAPPVALPVVLEVGFGMGEATAQMAADDPGTGILAVDVHTPGQGNLLRLAERRGLSNIRVANGDALILLRTMLAPGSLDGLRVYFPDPWPKKRHHKRRLIQPEFLDAAAPAIRSGGLVHIATDWSDYAERILDELTAHPEYENTQSGGGFAPRPAFRPLTRFEGQGLDKGHDVFDVLFRRR